MFKNPTEEQRVILESEYAILFVFSDMQIQPVTTEKVA